MMRINPDEILRDCLYVSDTEIGRQVIDAGNDSMSVVIHFADGQYAVFPWSELRIKLKSWKRFDVPLAQMPVVAYQSNLALSIDPNLQDPVEREQVEKAKWGTVFVLRSNGEFVGVWIKRAPHRPSSS